ncbi:MAG: hypothetical protein INR71_02350, partial [Terriglobus roseus]|nr:hypothetical protein [Terriglobus roseus]
RSTAAPAASVKRETSVKKPDPPKPKAPEVDLFSFDEPEQSAPAAAASNGKAPATAATSGFGALQAPAAAAGDDDDFDDFQSAGPPASMATTTASTQFAAPQPMAGAQASNINNLFASISPPPQQSSASTPMTASQPSAFSPPPAMSPSASTPFAAAAQRPTGYQPSGPNYFQSVPSGASASSTPAGVMSPTGSIGAGSIGGAAKKAPASGDAFASLLGGPKKAAVKGPGPSMADMAKQKTSQSLWGAPGGGAAAGPPAASMAQKPNTGSSGLDDLLG